MRYSVDVLSASGVEAGEGDEAHRGERSGTDCRTPVSLRAPWLKRPFDALLAAIALAISLPLWGLISLLIWLEDGTPIFFRQQRIGKYGRLFTVLKYRSMIKDPDRVEIQATKGDSRITRVGRILRMTAMDELPQIWSILIGDMSFVGPRSQPEKEIVQVAGKQTELYVREVPGFALRQLVRPGLTGIAQLFAPREVAHRNKFRYDLIYVRRVMRSEGLLGNMKMFFYDLGLILRSVWMTLTCKWEI